MIPTRVVFKWLLKVMTRLLSDWLNYLVQLFQPMRSKTKSDGTFFRALFPSLRLSYRQFLGIPIGSSRCWLLMWLVGVKNFGFGFSTVTIWNRSSIHHTLVSQSFPHQPSGPDSWCTKPCLFQQSRTAFPVLFWPCLCCWSVVWNFCPCEQKLINQSELSVGTQGKLLQCMFLLANNNYFLRNIFRMVRTFWSRLQLLQCFENMLKTCSF